MRPLRESGTVVLYPTEQFYGDHNFPLGPIIGVGGLFLIGIQSWLRLFGSRDVFDCDWLWVTVLIVAIPLLFPSGLVMAKEGLRSVESIGKKSLNIGVKSRVLVRRD